MSTFYANLLYYSLAALLLPAGLWLGWWSLFRDRARGGRRCPKCWYDLRGTPGMRCSECGFTAARERQLQHTHRHWRLAALALILTSAGATAAVKPKADRDGWMSLIPTPALVLLMPPLGRDVWWDQNKHRTYISPVVREFIRRDAPQSLSDWEWRYLIDHGGIIQTRSRWPKDIPLYVSIRMPRWLGLAELTTNGFPDGPVATGGTLEPETCGNETVERTARQACQLLGTSTRVCDRLPLMCHLSAGKGTASLYLGLTSRWTYDQPIEQLWTGTFDLPVQIVSTMAEAIRPISLADAGFAMFRRALTVSVNVPERDDRDDVWLELALNRDADSALANLGFGFSVDYLFDGSIVESLQLSPTVNDDFSLRTYPTFKSYAYARSRRLLKHDLQPPDQLARWTIRIRGDAEMALRDWDRDQYWDGEFTLPLAEALTTR